MADNKIKPTAYAGSEPYIFVSYAHKDSYKAFPFIAALQNYGYNVWFDEGIRFGKEWEDEIAEKLLGCSLFLFLVSARSLESIYCKNEIRLASEEKKPFVNVIAENDLSFPGWYRLSYMGYQDCRLFNYHSYEKAVEALSQKVSEMTLTQSAGGVDYKREADHQDGIQLYPGAYVEFGSYPQTSDGIRKPIEWLVLDNDGENALLISRYALDAHGRPYGSLGEYKWETCSWRQWLNDSFVKNAFSPNEQKLIQNTYNTVNGSALFGNTTDKVFLLSYEEAIAYFRSDEARKCEPTEYAESRGAYTEFDKSGKATCWWWLRPSEHYFEPIVDYDGSVLLENDYNPLDLGDAIRPALWVKLES